MSTDLHYMSLNLMKEGERVILANVTKAPTDSAKPFLIESDMVYSNFIEVFKDEIEGLAWEIVKENITIPSNLFVIIFTLHKNDRVAVQTTLNKKIEKTEQINELMKKLSTDMEKKLRSDFDELASQIEDFNTFTNNTMNASMEVKYPLVKALEEIIPHFEDVMEVWRIMEEKNPEFNLSKDYLETISTILMYANPDVNLLGEQLQIDLGNATAKILIEHMSFVKRFEHLEPFDSRRTQIVIDYLLHEIWVEHGLVPNEKKRDDSCEILALMATLIHLHRSLTFATEKFKKMYPKVSIPGLYSIPHSIAFLWSIGLDIQEHEYKEAGEYLFNSEQSQEIVTMALEALYETYGEEMDASLIAVGICTILEKTVQEGMYE